MTKKLGILGGKNHSLTMEYYYLVYRYYYANYNTYYYPEVILYSLDYYKILEFERSNDKKEYTKYIAQKINSLEKADADVVLMIADTCNLDFDKLRRMSKIPVFHMAEVVAQKAKEKKISTAILIGEKIKIETSSYIDICKKHGIDVIKPSSSEQEEIDKIFFDELFVGIFNPDSKEKLLKIINNYDVDGVIITSSEFSIILNQEEIDMYLFDVSKLHVQAAMEYLYDNKKINKC